MKYEVKDLETALGKGIGIYRDDGLSYEEYKNDDGSIIRIFTYIRYLQGPGGARPQTEYIGIIMRQIQKADEKDYAIFKSITDYLAALAGKKIKNSREDYLSYISGDRLGVIINNSIGIRINSNQDASKELSACDKFLLALARYIHNVLPKAFKSEDDCSSLTRFRQIYQKYEKIKENIAEHRTFSQLKQKLDQSFAVIEAEYDGTINQKGFFVCVENKDKQYVEELIEEILTQGKVASMESDDEDAADSGKSKEEDKEERTKADAAGAETTMPNPWDVQVDEDDVGKIKLEDKIIGDGA